MKKYNIAACGGTFDLFHKGHREFLHFAFSLSKTVYIGITSDFYTQRIKQRDTIEPFAKRLRTVEAFLKKEGFFDRAHISAIDDPYIPNVWKDVTFEAIVVTQDSLNGAKEINLLRRSMGQKTLPIVLHTLTKALDGLPISTTRIKQGIIDREGKVLINPIWLTKTLYLPLKTRQKLKKPFQNARVLGKMLHSIEHEKVITVGDVTTKLFIENNIFPPLAIVDFVVERQRRFSSVKDLGFKGSENVFSLNNPPGQLTPELFHTIKRVFEEKYTQTVIVINGEEDLSVLPVLLASPLSYTVFYGQPKIGTVMIPVTEKTKEKAYNLVSEFSDKPV